MSRDPEALARTMQRGALPTGRGCSGLKCRPVHNSAFWGYLSDDPIIRLQMDAFGAVGAGVVQLDAVAAVLAVDQQEVVDGLRYAKLLFTVQRYRMEGEAQAVKKPAVVCGQRVGVHWLAVGES